MVIVSPDAGGVERARAYAKRLGGELAIVDKRRTEDGTAEVCAGASGADPTCAASRMRCDSPPDR